MGETPVLRVEWQRLTVKEANDGTKPKTCFG